MFWLKFGGKSYFIIEAWKFILLLWDPAFPLRRRTLIKSLRTARAYILLYNSSQMIHLCQYLAAPHPSKTNPFVALDFAGPRTERMINTTISFRSLRKDGSAWDSCRSFKCPSGEPGACLIIQLLPSLLYFLQIRDREHASWDLDVSPRKITQAEGQLHGFRGYSKENAVC